MSPCSHSIDIPWEDWSDLEVQQRQKEHVQCVVASGSGPHGEEQQDQQRLLEGGDKGLPEDHQTTRSATSSLSPQPSTNYCG